MSRDAAVARSLEEFPGGDLIAQGITDLARGIETVPSLLVSIGAPRLARVGICVRQPIPSPELRLYERVSEGAPDAAHSRYNAWIRRLVSFERALECVT